MKWISIKDKLPDKNGWVFVLVQWHDKSSSRQLKCVYFDLAKLNFEEENGCCSSDIVTNYVKYWLEMEFPALPDGWTEKNLE